MDRFTTDSLRLPLFTDKLVENFSVLLIIIIHLQLWDLLNILDCDCCCGKVTTGSLATVLPGYHHHHLQPLPGPVRWTKPSSQRPYQGRPVDVMTDVINDLGVRILDRYLDDVGNVGFSPSGLGFVLVALYEGSAGSSSRQISEVLGLPNDRRITRIGLRDIHRRLRSYLDADAFLGGLTLNRDDINLRPEYEDILRFYGFDISDSGVDGNATTILPNDTTNSTTDSSTDSSNSTDSTTPPALSTLVDSTDQMTTQMSTAASSPMPTTINDAVEVITTDMTDGTNAALSMASSAGNSSTSNALPTSLNAMSQTIAMTNTTSTDATSGTTGSSTTTPMTTTLGISSSASTASRMISSSTIQGDNNSMNTATTLGLMQRLVGPSTDAEDMQTRSSIAVEATTPGDLTTSSTSTNSTTTSILMNFATSSTSMNPTTSFASTNPITNSTSPNPITNSTSANPITNFTSMNPIESSTLANLPMSSASTNITTNSTSTNPTTSPMSTSVSMSMSISMKNSSATTMNSSTTSQPENSTTKAAEDTAMNSVRKRRGVPHGPAGYFSSSADDGIWLDEFGRLNGHEDYPSQDEDIVVDPRRSTEVAFLVNGCDYSRVTAAAYTAVLPFAYFPSLRASLLEFPLDDPRYKILVMLPSESNGTRRLARLLATKPITLRHLRRSLQPNWITAVIPSFMLRGFVTLTPFLQRIGISDVFDPRASDLSPMSPDLGVYARDIQQSIGVNIRNNAKGGIGGADGGNEGQQESQSADLVRSTRGVAGLPPFFAADGAISPPTRGNPHYSSYPGAGNVLYEKAHPIPFVVDQPFLYFIIDDETSVTLLAGRIDDPLNSRML